MAPSGGLEDCFAAQRIETGPKTRSSKVWRVHSQVRRHTGQVKGNGVNTSVGGKYLSGAKHLSGGKHLRRGKHLSEGKYLSVC